MKLNRKSKALVAVGAAVAAVAPVAVAVAPSASALADNGAGGNISMVNCRNVQAATQDAYVNATKDLGSSELRRLYSPSTGCVEFILTSPFGYSAPTGYLAGTAKSGTGYQQQIHLDVQTFGPSGGGYAPGGYSQGSSTKSGWIGDSGSAVGVNFYSPNGQLSFAPW